MCNNYIFRIFRRMEDILQCFLNICNNPHHHLCAYRRYCNNGHGLYIILPYLHLHFVINSKTKEKMLKFVNILYVFKQILMSKTNNPHLTFNS